MHNNGQRQRHSAERATVDAPAGRQVSAFMHQVSSAHLCSLQRNEESQCRAAKRSTHGLLEDHNENEPTHESKWLDVRTPCVWYCHSSVLLPSSAVVAVFVFFFFFFVVVVFVVVVVVVTAALLLALPLLQHLLARR